MRAQAVGMVLAAANGTVRLCPPYASGGVGLVEGTGTAPPAVPTPDCPDPIATTGIAMTMVASPGHNTTHRWGEVAVSGSWDGTVLHVTSQRPTTPKDLRSMDESLPNAVPCAPPAGGWKLGGVQDDPAIGKIEKVVGPGVGQLAMGYPNGMHDLGPSNDLSHTAQVLVVGTTGDLDRARAAIRTVFTGNLCVVHADHSASEIEHQRELLMTAIGADWSQLHLMTTGDRTVRLGDETNEISVAYETQALRDVLAKVPGPTITVNAWLHPVG